MSNEEAARAALGGKIKAARLAKYGSIESAMRAAGVSRQTWKHAEDGKPVTEVSMAKIQGALGWNPNPPVVRAGDGNESDIAVESDTSRGDGVTFTIGRPPGISDEVMAKMAKDAEEYIAWLIQRERQRA